MLLSVFNLSLVLLIIRKADASRASRAFALFLTFTAAWSFSSGMAIYPEMNCQWVLFFIRADFFISTLMIISLLWFVAEFPYLLPKFSKLASLLVLSATPWLIICWSNLIVANLPATPCWTYIVAGKAMIYFSIWAIFTTLCAIAHLCWKLIKSRGIIRLQLIYIFSGIVVMALVGFSLSLIRPTFGYSTSYAFLGPISSLVMSISSTYAIMKYRMLEIRLVARFFLLYLISLPVMAATIALFFFLLDKITPDHSTDYLLLYPIAGSILLAIIYQPVRNTVLYLLDKWLFRDGYDFGRVLLESGYKFVATITTAQVADVLQESLQKSVQPLAAALYLANRDSPSK